MVDQRWDNRGEPSKLGAVNEVKTKSPAKSAEYCMRKTNLESETGICLYLHSASSFGASTTVYSIRYDRY